jgi:hypothetical protein
MARRNRNIAPVVEVVEAAPEVSELEQQLQARIAELEAVLAQRENHLLYTSTMQKPVQLVRDQFVKWVQSGKPLSRKGVVDLCVAMGVARNTAATQYQYQFKRYNSGELVIPPLEG